MDLVNYQTITKDKSKSKERKQCAILVAIILISFILIGSTIINGSVMAIKIKQHRQFGPQPPNSQGNQLPERGSSNIIQLLLGNKTTGNLTTGQPAAPGNSSLLNLSNLLNTTSGKVQNQVGEQNQAAERGNSSVLGVEP